LKPRTRLALRIAITAVLLVVILARAGADGLTAIPLASAAVAIPALAVLVALGQGMAALRWRVVIGEGAPPWLFLARLYFIGGFFSLFLPTLVGGDGFRAAAAARALPDAGTSVASVLLDRIFGMFAMMGFALAGAVLAPEFARAVLTGAEWKQPSTAMLIAVLGVGAVIGVLLARSASARKLVAETRAAALRVALAPGRTAVAIFLGFVVQGIYIVGWVVATLALDVQLAPTTLLLAVPLVTLGGMLPLSIAGLGLREGAWLFLLRDAAIPPARIVAFSLVFFFGTMLVGIAGGILFALFGTGREPARPTPAR
jgi:uncharacterized membrane protein YbhN (UPF0104 family)